MGLRAQWCRYCVPPLSGQQTRTAFYTCSQFTIFKPNQPDITKSTSSTPLQALLVFSPYSPASCSAQWSFTSLIKSSQASSKDTPANSNFVMSLLNALADCYVLFFSEALPFFLLLIDLSKACALAKFALSSSSQVWRNTSKKYSHIWMTFNSIHRMEHFTLYLFFRMKWGTTLLVVWQYWDLLSHWMPWLSA